MTHFEQVLNQFNEQEQEVINRFWDLYKTGRGRKKNPDSINQRAKALGISPQALWERENKQKLKTQAASD